MAGIQDALEGYATEDMGITKTYLITAIIIQLVITLLT